MILKFRLGKFRLTITLAPVINVIGVNSLLPDGKHIPMWDFDDVPLNKVKDALLYAQTVYGLPHIYILKTKEPNNYMAYSFKRCSWWYEKRVIAGTKYVCENFFKWGVFRRRFTLRVSPKCGRKPKCVMILKSNIPEDAYIKELNSWVMYETLPDEHTPQIFKLGEK